MRPHTTQSAARRHRTRPQVAPVVGSPPRGAGHAPDLPPPPSVVLQPAAPMTYGYPQVRSPSPEGPYGRGRTDGHTIVQSPPPVTIEVPPQRTNSYDEDARTRRSRSSSHTATYAQPSRRPSREPSVSSPPPVIVQPAEPMARSYSRRRSPSPAPVTILPPPRVNSYDDASSTRRGRSSSYIHVQPPPNIRPGPIPNSYVQIDPDGPFSRGRRPSVHIPPRFGHVYSHSEASPPSPVIMQDAYQTGDGRAPYQVDEPWSRRSRSPSPPSPPIMIHHAYPSGGHAAYQSDEPWSRRRRPNSVFIHPPPVIIQEAYPSGGHGQTPAEPWFRRHGHGHSRPEPVIPDVYVQGPPPSHGGSSRSPSPSPSRNYEPVLAPWAQYVDDKYTDEWTALAGSLHEYDEAFIEGCKDDIDTLLVFAGLFSAILTAFNIESYKTLKQDSGDTTTGALVQISHQLNEFTTNGGTTISAQPPYNVPSFNRPLAAVRINSLWFSSLILALISASLGMLVKQWLREYLTGRFTSPQERVRVRHYRYEGLQRWRVFDIAALLPVLLQIALILFFIGLSDFLRQLDTIVGWVASGLILLWLILFTIGTLAPAVSYRCPYKVPFLKNITRLTRTFFSMLFRRRLTDGLSPYSLFPGDERGVRRDVRLDIPAILGADKLSGDDDFLERTLRPCLVGADGRSAVRFVRGILGHRLDKTVRSLTRIYEGDLDHITTKALYTSMYILIDALNPVLDAEAEMLVKDMAQIPVDVAPWMHEALSFLFCAVHYAYLRDRPIGSAMNSGLGLQRKLLVHHEKYMRECLVLLCKWQCVQCVVLLYIDSQEAKRMIEVLHAVLAENVAEPIHLCRVALSILQPIPRTLNTDHAYQQLLSQLADAIRVQASAVYVSRTTATYCLDLARNLNDRRRGFVPSELIDVLEDVEDRNAQPAPYVQPVTPFGPLVQLWSHPPTQNGRYHRSKPIPPPLR